VSFYDWLVPEASRQSLLLMFGAVGLVLLIACGNVASLMLARGAAREREFSVRAALGAERSRIVRQLLVEAMLLAVIAAAAGIAITMLTTKLVVAAAPNAVPRLDELSVDTTVIGFGLIASLLTAVIAAMVPAAHTWRASLVESLKDGARNATASRGRQRLRGALVIGEVALSVALLIGAGLLIRSFWRVQQVNPGFNTDHLVTMRINLPRPPYDGAKSRTFYQQLLPSAGALPGLSSVATSSGPPLSPGSTSSEVTVPGLMLPPNTQASADWRLVSPGYFRTLGVPLRGRDFEEADAAVDDKGTVQRRVVIISEEMARRYWPGGDPIGRTVIIHSFGSAPQTIVGVAGDIRSFGLDTEPGPMVYGSALAYSGWNPMSLVVRSAVEPSGFISGVRKAVRDLDANVPVYGVDTMTDLISTSLGARRFNMYLLVCFSAVAVVLACTGLFGVLAYVVAQRTRDIGVRMALGAQRGDVFRLIVGQGLILAVTGAVLGVAGGFGAARLMRSLLFSVTPNDPLTFLAVPALLIGVALLACYIPARRATRVDPLVALRAD
jgi:predicted permease